MIISSRDIDNEVRSSNPISSENQAGNNRDYTIVYTNDFDGAYHVEQDDEADDEPLRNHGEK